MGLKMVNAIIWYFYCNIRQATVEFACPFCFVCPDIVPIAPEGSCFRSKEIKKILLGMFSM